MRALAFSAKRASYAASRHRNGAVGRGQEPGHEIVRGFRLRVPRQLPPVLARLRRAGRRGRLTDVERRWRSTCAPARPVRRCRERARRARRDGSARGPVSRRRRRDAVRRYSETRRRHPFGENGLTLAEAIAPNAHRSPAARPRRLRLGHDAPDARACSRNASARPSRRPTNGGCGSPSSPSASSTASRSTPIWCSTCASCPTRTTSPAARSPGNDAPVARTSKRSPTLESFLDGIFALVDFLLPRYEREGKSQLTIAIGCTGGRHRSSTSAGGSREHLRAATAAP
jgi:hypothetical protein